MNAFLFKPSNEFVAKLKVGDASEVPDVLKSFLQSQQSVPVYSYVEASGRVWTITSINPLELRDGRLTSEKTGTAQDAPARAANACPKCNCEFNIPNIKTGDHIQCRKCGEVFEFGSGTRINSNFNIGRGLLIAGPILLIGILSSIRNHPFQNDKGNPVFFVLAGVIVLVVVVAFSFGQAKK